MKIQLLIYINQKYIKNLDLLDINFHTVTEPLLLKISNECKNKDFRII